ncbi:MAG TPA: PIG-L family deacetylase [Flavobacteriales bacterium]|nr:PIG-L family deacetylase [Flavobacteriales bacterium]HMR27643.1 PIG-L family deacetylase [Flavobacteriales bacterium]
MRLRSSPALRLAAVTLFLLSAFSFPLSAQRPPAQPHAAEILHKMQKLNVLGSVLYIVAHPDDENTRLIAWLANGKKVRTGNLSLTRGDGGQNLIGPELGDALGIIRTQELLEARRIDGGEQFFTRAVDFGYSKNAAESFEKWGKQEVLSDVVRVIRMFRPDVIITRFAPDRSAGHGHHEASAILAEEAFDLAGDPKAFPEHLEQGLEVWQPRRLFFNGSTWWNRDLATIAENDPDWFSVDVGGYDPLLGLSYTEIAGRSRSMHKSQGFGAAETRGEALEYLKLIKGDRPKGKDIFEGIDMTWGRVKQGKNGGELIASLILKYNTLHPDQSVPALWEIASFLDRTYGGDVVPSEWLTWYKVKRAEVGSIIAYAMGLVSEATSTQALVTTIDSIPFNFQLYPRRGKIDSAIVSELRIAPLLSYNRLNQGPIVNTMNLSGKLTPEQIVTEPYWLKQASGNLHDVPVQLIGLPVDFPFVRLYAEFRAPNRRTGALAHSTLNYKWVDRVAGERIRPVYVTPVASVIPKTDVLIATGGPQTITVEVEALTDSLTGQLNVTLPEGWATTKDLKLVNIAKRNERQRFTFQLMPMDNARSGAVKFTFTGPKGKADRTLHEIDYPHILPQVYYTPAEVKLVPLDVTTTAKRVGYVKGAGDDVPQAMEQLGVVVEFIEPSTAKLEELRKYDAIVTGIRAYNATKGMKELHPQLLQYVEEGGTLIVQYNTTPRFFSGASDFQIDPATLGPKPFSISRGRVTVEEAPPTFLDPKHPLISTPNTITAADFEGWVQERGLYFAGDFGDTYTPLIAWNDPGEQALTGALIATDHGKGRFIYTGISFFRQLPAGVPGAYRLFANLISPRSTNAK